MSELMKREEPTALQNVEPVTLMQVIARAASDPQTDVDKLERLMAMYERVEAKKAEDAYHQAMSRAQAKMRTVKKDAANDHTKSKYATYAALDRALRPAYSEEGLSLSFDTGEAPQPEWVRVLCYVSHKDGFSKTHHVDMPADGKGAKGGDVMTKTHAAGSAMSYGMRYLLKMIFNVAVGEDDDDGNAAGSPTITESQLADLRALLEEVKGDEAGFCKVCKVQNLADLPATKYKRAVEILEIRRKKNG